MSRRVSLSVALSMLLVCFVPTGAFGEEARAMSLEELVEMARSESHQVRQSRLEVRRAELAGEEARMGRWPTASAEAQYRNNLSLPVIVLPPDSPFGDVLRTGARHNFTGTLQVSVPVYSAQLNRSIEVSQAVATLEKALQEATVREVEVEVERAFLNGLVSRESYAVLRESHEALLRNLSLVEALYEEGLVPEYDLIRTEVQARNLEPELERARNGYQGALNYLKLLVGLPIEEAIELDGDLRDLYESRAGHREVAEFSENRDLMQLRGQEEVVRQRIGLERAAYWPTVGAFGTFSYQGQGDNLAVWDYNWTDTATVGLSLTIPLYSPGLRQRVEQAEVEALQVSLQREFLEESLRSQFDTTTRRLEELEAMIEAQERNVEQAERGYSIARQSYEEGAYSLMDVNDAEAALRDARMNYRSALAEYVQAVLDLEDLLGRRGK